MATREKNLEGLFVETLREIYSAEKAILRALPRMAKAANSDRLRQAFEQHRDETEDQVERLERIFEQCSKAARGRSAPAVDAMIEEAKDVIDEFKGSEVVDAGLLAAAQAIEHYEISRYGTLKTWAGQLGTRDAAELLETTLQEEKKADRMLTEIAEAEVNVAAERAQGEALDGQGGRHQDTRSQGGRNQESRGEEVKGEQAGGSGKGGSRKGGGGR
jgi:ferritin-like metal-binding protein YciE